MATLHLSDIPEELHRRLRRQAAAESRSLSAQVILLLHKALDEPEHDQGAILDEIRRLRIGRQPPDSPDSVELIRQDRRR